MPRCMARWRSKSRPAPEPRRFRLLLQRLRRPAMHPGSLRRSTAPAVSEASPAGAPPYATMSDLYRPDMTNVTRRLLIVFALVAGLVAACWLTYSVAWQNGIDNLRRNAAVRVERTASTLKSTLERYESLPYLLAEHPIVQDALVDPSPANVERANLYLEDLNRHARATVTYIIPLDGYCVAASNWQGPGSFI